jgi:class 3 adenylate cyclase
MLEAVADGAAGDRPWRIRIGIHRGPVVAGVIGSAKFAYDVWGDTVNVSARLETAAEPGSILISAPVAAALGNRFVLEPRGKMDLKGKGPTEVWVLRGRSAASS